MKTTARTAAIYLRQSSDPTGKGAAVGRQREDCEKLCADKGWATVEYVDNDISASTGKRRPAYARMLADIADGRIDAVVCYHLDRLHRRPIELEHFITLADEKGVALVTVTGDTDLGTDDGQFVARIMAAVARKEVDRKSARQKRASLQRAKRGEPGWKRAFGYLDHQPDPRTAPMVRAAYAHILAGGSLSDVCREWNAAGELTPRGTQWRVSVLGLFLRSPRNAGLRVCQEGLIEGTWPGLVDEATWRAACAALDSPERIKPGRKSVRRHLLTGLLICGGCGGDVWSGTEGHLPRSAQPKTLLYNCRTCFNCSITGRNLEARVYELVIDRLARPDAINLLRREIHDEAEAETLRLEANALNAEMDNIGLERADGLLTGRQAKLATDRLAAKLEAVERRWQDQERVRVFHGLPLGEPEVAESVLRLSPDRFRAVLDALATVTVHRGGRNSGGPRFNTDRVQLDWK